MANGESQAGGRCRFDRICIAKYGHCSRRGGEAKEQAELVKKFESPFEQAVDKKKELQSVKDRLDSASYDYCRQTIVDDYMKAKERGTSREHHDEGESEEWGSQAAFKAVQESWDALAGLQEKQTELLEAQNDLQGHAVDKLTDIVSKIGGGSALNVVGSLS